MKNEQTDKSRIEDLINSSISKIKSLSDSNTIIGDQIKMFDGSVIVPVSKVSVGFVTGGSEFSTAKKTESLPMGGASGGGVSVTPIGFIVQSGSEIKFVDITVKNTYDTFLNIADKVLQKLGDSMNGKDNKNND